MMAWQTALCYGEGDGDGDCFVLFSWIVIDSMYTACCGEHASWADAHPVPVFVGTFAIRFTASVPLITFPKIV